MCDKMDFSKRIGKLSPGGSFTLDGYYVWCGTMTRDEDGLYYLFFSFWVRLHTRVLPLGAEVLVGTEIVSTIPL